MSDQQNITVAEPPVAQLTSALPLEMVASTTYNMAAAVARPETKQEERMYVIKRKGTRQPIDKNKILKRILFLVENPTKLHGINVLNLSQQVVDELHSEINTYDIDEFTADRAANMMTYHVDYGVLAARISINNHHKRTRTSFRDKIEELYLRKDMDGKSCPLIADNFYKFVLKNQKAIEERINYEFDYNIDFFGFKTLEKSYLLHINKKVIERPQDLWMRMAITCRMTADYYDPNSLQEVFKVYDLYANRKICQASPTMFNAGCLNPQMFSCFLTSTEDSLDGINKTYNNISKISKWAGGIGIHISMIRATSSLIRSTNGPASGIVPVLKIYNDAVCMYNQGGKRPGNAAIYLEPHHPDIFKFLDLKRIHGDDKMRARDLFYAVWVSDLFMKRAEADKQWSLFCPDECPGLNDVWGEEYEQLYTKYEMAGKAREVVLARKVLFAIYESIKESGVPYICFKDTFNRYNMQSNLGIIRSSNLCVAGDTLVLTDNGYANIKQLTESGPQHNVWNGEKFTPATFAKTGSDQELLEIETSHGNSIKCTPYHKFIIVSDSECGQYNKEYIVPASKLTINSRLVASNIPEPHKSIVDSKQPEYIKSICTLEQREDTYCFNEPLLNRGIFNGMLLGNCSEIALYSDHNEYAVCCLGNIVLPNYIYDTWTDTDILLPEEQRRQLNHEFPQNPYFNYQELVDNTRTMVRNLDNLLDKNYYPVVETARSAFKTRAVGVGVQGLADVFMKFRVPFESPAAADLNKKIFEAIHYGSISESTEICRDIYRTLRKKIIKNGSVDYSPYPDRILEHYPELHNEPLYKKYTMTYTDIETLPKTVGAYPVYLENGGSPLANGKFHWELYAANPSGIFDWESLRGKIAVYGMRHSHLNAAMPTASTSQIMGNIEGFEPYKANIYMRKTQAGEYLVINKFLYNDFKQFGIDTETARNYLLVNNGSVQHIPGFPSHLKGMYKTAYEIKQKTIINMARDRQPFIDQSQSMNLFFEKFTYDEQFYKVIMYGWKSGLKTGSYYIKTKAAADAQNISMDPEVERKIKETILIGQKDEEICTSCG